MSLVTLLVIVAALLAFGELLESRGRSLLGWAVLCLAVALVWGDPFVSI